VDWWWENRIFFHQPQGWVDSSIYEVAGFYPYRDAVYLRGAMFLGEVRDLMGEEPFLDFLRDYLEKYSHRQANGDDFFNLLSVHTSVDLSGLISSYFNQR
jgi:aminopeptidase N